MYIEKVDRLIETLNTLAKLEGVLSPDLLENYAREVFEVLKEELGMRNKNVVEVARKDGWVEYDYKN